MKKSLVAIVKGEDPKRVATRALKLIDAGDLVSPSDKVLIKPNYILAKPPESGITTDPRVIDSVIDFLHERGIRQITVGEGGLSTDTADEAFRLVGLTDIAARKNVKLVNLNRDETVRVSIPDALVLKEANVAKTALESTCIINVPKLKVHKYATVTLGMKNLMGAIQPKGAMHTSIHEKLVDLTRLLKPKLTIIDGVYGEELDEIHGRPVKMGIVIASEDVVAADAVGAAVMGINPVSVPHIALAHEMKLGVGRLIEIEVVGSSIEEVQREFQLPSRILRIVSKLLSSWRYRIRPSGGSNVNQTRRG